MHNVVLRAYGLNSTVDERKNNNQDLWTLTQQTFHRLLLTLQGLFPMVKVSTVPRPCTSNRLKTPAHIVVKRRSGSQSLQQERSNTHRQSRFRHGSRTPRRRPTTASGSPPSVHSFDPEIHLHHVRPALASSIAVGIGRRSRRGRSLRA